MLFDTGLGILIAIFVSEVFGIPLTPLLIGGGIFFSLIMDFDFLFHVKRGGGVSDAHHHRTYGHYPLLYIPCGVVVISFFSILWAALFFLCSLAHFIHDSIGIGWGVQWLYPFRTDHYGFFYRYTPKTSEKIPFKFLYVWKHNDIPALSEKYGDKNWIRNIYVRWHPYAIIEFVVFLVSLLTLYFFL